MSSSCADTAVPQYLVETIQFLLRCLQLSPRQNEISFPSSLLAYERSFVHNRAKEMGFYPITRRGPGFSNRYVCVYKTSCEKLTMNEYKLVLPHETLLRILTTMSKIPLTATELRTFVLCREQVDTSQNADIMKNRNQLEMDFNFPTLTFPSSKHRESLPISKDKNKILNLLYEFQVVIVHGGVASGKSTQVPQYIMENHGYKIIICEPYRITAVAVAERIAYERKEEIGQSVGYQIPLETKKSATSVIICVTPDVLLKMLIAREQIFQQKIVVIIDEFEECDYITEFILIALKDLFKTNHYLRLILMTNANDVGNLVQYFQMGRTGFDMCIKTTSIQIMSTPIPIQELFLEDILEKTGYLNRTPINGSYCNRNATNTDTTRHDSIQVIENAMTKVWATGDEDAFIFLINAIKRGVISVNYKLRSAGVTNLMCACHCGKKEFVSELLKLGADVTIRCRKGRTAIEWSSHANHPEIVEYLQNHLLSNNQNAFSDREFLTLTALKYCSEHTGALINYYSNFYPEDGVDMELLFTILQHIHAFGRKGGAVILFLPSFNDILTFREILFERESELVSSGGGFVLRFLYSNMQTCEQKAIFQVPSSHCRKIILSTNVGAVGITISDLRYVIDTGKIEQKLYTDHTGRLSFITDWTTSLQALQRSSKIGRLQSGCCYRMYPRFKMLKERNPPATLPTCSPQMLCLFTKQIVLYEAPVMSFLARMLTIPDASNINESTNILKSIDAFDINKHPESLTELGRIILQLPLEPQYAKMVLYGVALKCLDPILTVAAFSKHKSTFNLEEKYKTKSNEAAKKWKSIASKFFSDHLVLIQMFLGRQTAGVRKREKEFCEEHCISRSTLELVNTTRSNIVGHLRAMGIVKTRGVNDMRELNSNSKEWVFVKAALVGGLYPNLVAVDSNTNKLYCHKNRKEVILNPLSVLLDYSHEELNKNAVLTQNDVVKEFPTDWIVCNEINDMYSENTCTATVCTNVTPIMLALFAGSYKIGSAVLNQRTALLVQNNAVDFEDSDSEEGQLEDLKNFMIDLRLQFNMDTETAKALFYLRVKWFSYFFRSLRFPTKSMSGEDKQILDTVATVLKNEEKCRFLPGDPHFIGNKPDIYTIDLQQQPATSKSSELNAAHHVKNVSTRELITENSRYFIIKSYNQNNINVSLLKGIWKFEPDTEAKLLQVYRSGAEVKLIFQFHNTNCFQGIAELLSDRDHTGETDRDSNALGSSRAVPNTTGFLPIRWLKEGLVSVSAVEEYVDPITCNKLKNSPDGAELECSLASVLGMMWNTSQMMLRSSI